jgi:hypothetical protein
MAGSLSHIVAEDGSFRFDLLDNMGDCYEALEECFDIIGVLVNGDGDALNAVCAQLNYPAVDAAPIPGRRTER